MPVDMHPKEGVSGVELILTRLHAGAQVLRQELHASPAACTASASRVVNALSKKLQVWVRRDGNEYTMTFARRRSKSRSSKVVGTVGKTNTGTTVRFWPDAKFFDSPKFTVPRAQARACAPRPCSARACASRFINEVDPARREEWYYEDGLHRLPDVGELAGRALRCRRSRSSATSRATNEEVDWAVVWLAEEASSSPRATST